jgi:hypothetical protein
LPIAGELYYYGGSIGYITNFPTVPPDGGGGGTYTPTTVYAQISPYFQQVRLFFNFNNNFPLAYYTSDYPESGGVAISGNYLANE